MISFKNFANWPLRPLRKDQNINLCHVSANISKVTQTAPLGLTRVKKLV